MKSSDKNNRLQLDGLFGHLSCSNGLYAKDTFVNLYSCIAKMIRDHHLEGFALTSTLGDEEFDTAACALDNLRQLEFFRVDENVADKKIGFLLVLIQF